MTWALFDTDHEAFRRAVGSYLDNKVVPFYQDWEHAGEVPERFFRDMGNLY